MIFSHSILSLNKAIMRVFSIMLSSKYTLDLCTEWYMVVIVSTAAEFKICFRSKTSKFFCCLSSSRLRLIPLANHIQFFLSVALSFVLCSGISLSTGVRYRRYPLMPKNIDTNFCLVKYPVTLLFLTLQPFMFSEITKNCTSP